MKIDYFKTEDFHSALQLFFQGLNIPVNYIAEEPVRPQEILSDTYKPDHEAFQLMNDVYFLGMVDDAAFDGNASLAPEKIKSDSDDDCSDGARRAATGAGQCRRCRRSLFDGAGDLYRPVHRHAVHAVCRTGCVYAGGH